MNTREKLENKYQTCIYAIEHFKKQIINYPNQVDEFISKIIEIEKVKMQINQAINVIDQFIEEKELLTTPNLPSFEYEKFQEMTHSLTAYIPHYDEEVNGLCLVDGMGFIMEYDLMVQVLRGITTYLSKRSRVDIEIENHQQMMKHKKALESKNSHSREYSPIHGYLIVISIPQMNGYKFLYGASRKMWVDETAGKLQKRLDGLKSEFLTDVEVIKVWENVYEIYKFYNLLKERFANRRDKEKRLYNMTEEDVKVIKNERFETKALRYLYGPDYHHEYIHTNMGDKL